MFNPTDSTPVIATSSILLRVVSVTFTFPRRLADVYFVAQHRNIAYQSVPGISFDSSFRWDSSEFLFHNILKETAPIAITFNSHSGDVESPIASLQVSLEGLIPSGALVRSRSTPAPASAGPGASSTEPPPLALNIGYQSYPLTSSSGSVIGTTVIYVGRCFFPSHLSAFSLSTSSGVGGWFLSKNKKQQIAKEQEYLKFAQGFMGSIFSQEDADSGDSLTVRESMSVGPPETASLPVAFSGTANVFGIGAPHAPQYQSEVYSEEERKKRVKGRGASGTVDPFGCSPESMLLQVLGLLKEEVGRQIFVQQLIPQSSVHYSLSQPNFTLLSDVIAAGLRQASNTKDFYFCKILLDQSFHFFSRDPSPPAPPPPSSFNSSSIDGAKKVQNVTFLYTRVKQHEVFRRAEFWNLVFLDAFPYERKLQETIHNFSSDSSSGASSSAAGGAANPSDSALDWLCVRDLLLMIAGMQFAANMDFDAMLEFMKEQSLKYRLPPAFQSQLNQFYQLQHDTLKREGAIVSMPGASEVGATENSVSRGPDGKDINHTATNKSAGGNIRISGLISNFTCLGEYSINKFDDVALMNISPCWAGKLHVTNYQIIFLADDTSVQSESRNAPLLYIPLGSIHKYEFLNANSSSSVGGSHSFVQENSAYPSYLTIYTKDLRTIVFGFKFDVHNKELWEFVKFIKRSAFTQDLKKTFAFIYKDVVLPQHNGWFMNYGSGASTPSIFEMEAKRMNLESRFKLFTGNLDFKFIPTYPSAFLINNELSEDDLYKIKQFRSKGRIPAVTFKYFRNGALIFRSAQPNIGITFGRCSADERLLQMNGIRAIFDARPKANAVANQAKGGGYENIDHYVDCKIVFLDIHNIHVMRESLNKLYSCMQNAHNSNYNANPSMEEYYIQLHASAWLRHVRTCLIGAFDCAATISSGQSILIHCSDGWDRTSQLTSLTQLILDPYYRTRAGFAILITKEWLEFGHQFNKRTGHCRKDTGDHERSPIFLQFLDCVYQLITQFPTAFEFNETYINALAEHLYSNKFGSFLHNNEKERAADKVKLLTVSVFTELNKESNASLYVNLFYQKNLYSGLRVNTDVRAMQLWPFYYRENRNISKRHQINNERAAREMLRVQENELQGMENLLIQQANELNDLRKKLGLPTQPLPISFRETVRSKGKVKQENQNEREESEKDTNTALRKPKLTFSSAAAIRPPGAEVKVATGEQDDSPPLPAEEPEPPTKPSVFAVPPGNRAGMNFPPPLPSSAAGASGDGDKEPPKPSALLAAMAKAGNAGGRNSLIARSHPVSPRGPPTLQRRNSAGDTKEIETASVASPGNQFKTATGTFVPPAKKLFGTVGPMPPKPAPSIPPPLPASSAASPTAASSSASPPPMPSSGPPFPLSGIAARKLAFQVPPPPVPNTNRPPIN